MKKKTLPKTNATQHVKAPNPNVIDYDTFVHLVEYKQKIEENINHECDVITNELLLNQMGNQIPTEIKNKERIIQLLTTANEWNKSLIGYLETGKF